MENLVNKETIKNKAKEYFKYYISIFYATTIIPTTYVIVSLLCIVFALINIHNIWFVYWFAGLVLVSFLKVSIISSVVSRKKELYSNLDNEVSEYAKSHEYQVEENSINGKSKHISGMLNDAILELNHEIIAKYGDYSTKLIKIASMSKSEAITQFVINLNPYHAFSAYYGNMKQDIVKISQEVLMKK